ncbi:MAG: hypothetical protein IJZ20_05835, partial [Clostridia bacterium]|nr:hypothetical protein [Clostridia bacterium]
ELFQFFGAFGLYGVLGLFAAISILAVFNLMIIKIVRKNKNAEIDKTVVGANNKPLLFSVGVLESVIFFGTFVVMAAGFGALVQKLTGNALFYYIGSFVFCLVIAFLAIKGITGLVNIFSFAVPVLVVITAIVGILALVRYGGNGLDLTPADTTNPLIPNWIAGAVTFASYNLFCAIGVLCPVGLRVKNGKSAMLGTVLGSIFLILVAAAVLISLAVFPSAKSEELPMMAVAQSISPALSYVYAFLMFLAMTGASLASVIPIVSYLADHSKACEIHGAVTTFVLCFLAFLLSCFGFADLVGTLFSSFGYISLLGLLGLTLHYFKVRKKQK